jgi:zinc protease
MSAATYLNHPYRRPVIGWDHEIRALGTKKAIAFYRAHYAPNNAVLVVAGDVTEDEIRTLAEKYFGPIPRRAVPPRIRPAEPPHHAEARVVLKDARVKQPQWMRDYLAPSYTEGDSKHTAALQVLAQILGGDSSSRLYRRLVVEEGLAAGVGVAYSPASVNLTEFSFQVAPRPDVPLEKIEAALDAEIAKVLEQGVTAEELARAKRQLVTQATYARDSMAGAARLFGIALATGGTIEQVEFWPDRIAAVTIEQVNEGAAAVLRRENSTTGELIPQPAS